MTKQLTSQVQIEASPGIVWDILCDFEAFSEWNPFIVHGARDGSRLTLRMQPEGGRPMTLKPEIVVERAGERLTWRGKLGVSGLLDAEHTFDLEAHEGGTRVVQSERFTGLLVPLVSRSLDRGTLPAFRAMDRALKRRSEMEEVALVA